MSSHEKHFTTLSVQFSLKLVTYILDALKFPLKKNLSKFHADFIEIARDTPKSFAKDSNACYDMYFLDPSNH